MSQEKGLLIYPADTVGNDYQQAQNKKLQDEEQVINFDLNFSLDDDKYYKLPSKKYMQISSQQFTQQITLLPVEIQDSYIKIKDLLDNQILGWDFKQSDYLLVIPPSGFKDSQTPAIRYIESTFNEEYNEVKPLSQSQLKTVAETGTFEIPSNNFPVPYLWKLSPWIVKGSKDVLESLHQDLSSSFNQLMQIGQRWSNSTKYISVCKGLTHIVVAPIAIIQMLIGFRCLYPVLTPTIVHQKVEEYRQIRLNQNDQFKAGIFCYLSIIDSNNCNDIYIEIRQRKADLENILSNFEINIKGMLTREIQYAYDMNQKNDESVFEQDDEEEKEQLAIKAQSRPTTNYILQFNISLDYTKPLEQAIEMSYNLVIIQIIKESALPLEVKNHYLELIEWTKLYTFHKQREDDEIIEQQKRITSQLEKDSPIRFQVALFREQRIKQLMTPIIKQIKNQTQKDLKSLLSQQYPDQLKLYDDFLIFQTTYQSIYEQTQDTYQKLYERPSKIFTLTRSLFPSYKVQTVQQSGQQIYFIKRIQSYDISTNYYFWRIILGFMRWYVWSLKISFYLFCNAFLGPFGIKALFCIHAYHPDVECDPQTGVIQSTPQVIQTVISSFARVILGMNSSRDEFERSPDTGFFGKSLARLWNYFEVYVFRLIVVGILIVLMLFPMAIIFNTIFSTILALTTWLWIPIALIIRFMISTFIYDFDGIHKRDVINKRFLVSRKFPIFNKIFFFIVGGILQTLISFICMLIVHPVVAAFILLFGYLRYFFRSLYDCFMICIVRKFGRVPKSQSKLAWRIGGPGISRPYFYEINKEDIFVLLYAQLEKTLLTEYQTRYRQLMYQPLCDHQKILKSFFQPFNAQCTYQDRGTGELAGYLDSAINNIKARYPKSPQNDVRFTSKELVSLLRSTKQFIKAQIKLKDMTKYIWSSYGVKQGNYNQLTRVLWQRIFRNSNIFEPFEDLDMRFKLTSDNRSFLNIHQIKLALKGSVNLEQEYTQTIDSKQVAILFQQPYLRYLNPDYIIRQILLTQNAQNEWSSHENNDLAVYMNYRIKDKQQKIMIQ